MSYTADSIRDSIRIRIVTPDSIRIRFERKRPIRRSLGATECQCWLYKLGTVIRAIYNREFCHEPIDDDDKRNEVVYERARANVNA